MTPSPAQGDRLAATRWSYDAVAAAYADAFSDELRRKPLDRALLTAFAEQVQQHAPARGRVWDIGCGPGHVTAFLAGLGLDTAGIDLSDGMVAQARARHPDLEFRAGSMTTLPAGSPPNWTRPASPSKPLPAASRIRVPKSPPSAPTSWPAPVPSSLQRIPRTLDNPFRVSRGHCVLGYAQWDSRAAQKGRQQWRRNSRSGPV